MISRRLCVKNGHWSFSVSLLFSPVWPCLVFAYGFVLIWISGNGLWKLIGKCTFKKHLKKITFYTYLILKNSSNQRVRFCLFWWTVFEFRRLLIGCSSAASLQNSKKFTQKGKIYLLFYRYTYWYCMYVIMIAMVIVAVTNILLTYGTINESHISLVFGLFLSILAIILGMFKLNLRIHTIGKFK